jgi:hypothetical protein
MLSFGYNQGLPTGVAAAWGARLIATQDGGLDFLGNRQSFYDGPDGDQSKGDAVGQWINGTTEETTNALDGAPFKIALETARDLLKSGRMSTREAQEFRLYEDETGVIVANTNASAGYLYVAAWLKADAPVAS